MAEANVTSAPFTSSLRNNLFQYRISDIYTLYSIELQRTLHKQQQPRQLRWRTSTKNMVIAEEIKSVKISGIKLDMLC